MSCCGYWVRVHQIQRNCYQQPYVNGSDDESVSAAVAPSLQNRFCDTCWYWMLVQDVKEGRVWDVYVTY